MADNEQGKGDYYTSVDSINKSTEKITLLLEDIKNDDPGLYEELSKCTE